MKETQKNRLSIAKSRLELYYRAEKAILNGQSYEVEGLKLTRANLTDVQKMISDLESLIDKLIMKGYTRTRMIIPKDGW